MDTDGDGYGTLLPTIGAGGAAVMLHPGATAEQIGTGDVLIQRFRSDGLERQVPTSLHYMFATTAALVSYSDGAGNTARISYPVAGPPVPGPGSRENPLPVNARASGDVIVDFRFWRPQRRPIPPETARWIDIGGLYWGMKPANFGGSCPQRTLSESDPNLIEPPLGPYSPTLKDTASDRPADSARTVGFKVNVSACLRSPESFPGLFVPSQSFDPGETRGVDVRAISHGANDGESGQSVWFKRVR